MTKNHPIDKQPGPSALDWTNFIRPAYNTTGGNPELHKTWTTCTK